MLARFDIRPLIAVAVLLCAPNAALWGQSTFGSIVGVAMDEGKGVISDAHVTIRSLDENTIRETVTAAEGSFQFLNIKPGSYELIGSKDGFAVFRISRIQVDARQTVRANLAFQLEAVRQSVVVESAAPVVNTENGTIADTKSFNQVTQLPMNYRGSTTSPLAALATVPGAQQDANGNISLGGGTPSQVQYSVDGASTVNVRQNGALGNMNPSSELISEFRVTQFNNNAEFAQIGDVTITTRSGTNNIHGSAFEYLQNSALDATTYGFDEKAHKAFNTLGGSFSGPVNIPHVYKGTDRTFFFADYEANRRRFATPQQFSVPTAAMRSGDLSSLPGSLVIDPSTAAPFPGNRIPAARLNPVTQNLFANYLPLPNFGDGTDTNSNYRRQTRTPGDTNGYDIRIDHYLSARQQLYGRWSWKNVDSTIANAILPSDLDHETNRNFVVSHNFSIRPTLINEARFGITFYAIHVAFPIQGAAAIRTLGLNGLDLSDVPGVAGFPIFNFSDGTGFTSFGRDKAGVTESRTLQFTDNLTWVKGKHNIKMGGDLRRLSYRDLESFGGADDFGAFNFAAGTFSGNAFGDLLLGLPANSYIAQSGPDVRAHAFHTGLYVQDDWRASSRLTLSFGLRWQALPPFVSELNNLTAFDKRNGGVIVPDNATLRAGFLAAMNACPGVNPALPCGPITRASDVGLGAGVREFYKMNFQPRFGFAYRPSGTGKTVIRGGFGIFTMTNLGQLSFNTTNIAVSVVRTTANSLLPGGQPAFAFPGVKTADDPLTVAGTQDFYQNVPTNYRDPQSAQWNLTIERELIPNLGLRVSYVGMNSYRLSQTVDLNQVPSSTSPYNADARPYRNWGRILSSENQGFANYQSLQTEVNRRFSGGLMFQGSYNWAKSLADTSGDAPGAFAPEVIYGTAVADRFNLRLNRGDAAGTRRQRALISGIYQIPVGRDRKFFQHLNTLGNAALGGWEMSTIAMVETGPHLTPTISPNLEQANLNLVNRQSLLRPDRIGNGNISNPTPDRYFDIAAFVPTPDGAGRIGNSGVGILTGPGTATAAIGLAKSFVPREGLRLRFEATFTNIANHPNFAAPATDVTTPATFGKITSVQSAENAGNRTGQFALRLDF